MKNYYYDELRNEREFHFDNITNGIEGAQPREGDFIERVRFGNEIDFTDGWTVEKINGKLGIVWGYKKEFIPFDHFASRTIFTIREEIKA